MQFKNKYISAAFKAVLCLVGLAGITVQSGIFEGNFNLSIFRYYTLLSNVLCCLYFGAATVFAYRGKTFIPKFKSMLIMGITVTGLVYHFMLSESTFSMGGAMAFSNIVLHYAVPIMSVADWILFDEKGTYTWKTPLSWVILPDAYFVLATLYGFTVGNPFYGGSRFPYFFIDYDTIGVGKVFLYVIILNIAFSALGYIYYFADKGMAKLKRIDKNK